MSFVRTRTYALSKSLKTKNFQVRIVIVTGDIVGLAEEIIDSTFLYLFQKVFVIMAFNENLINMAVSHISEIPIVGGKLEGPFKEMLAKQKQNFHRSSTEQSVSSPSLLAWIFEKFVLLMVLYFILSIVNSLAQSYHKRINKIQPKSEGGKTDWEEIGVERNNLQTCS